MFIRYGNILNKRKRGRDRKVLYFLDYFDNDLDFLGVAISKAEMIS